MQNHLSPLQLERAPQVVLLLLPLMDEAKRLLERVILSDSEESMLQTSIGDRSFAIAQDDKGEINEFDNPKCIHWL